jgi:hypothetical protein
MPTRAGTRPGRRGWQAEEKHRQLLRCETAEDVRFHERTTVERVNGRLKDEFGAAW